MVDKGSVIAVIFGLIGPILFVCCVWGLQVLLGRSRTKRHEQWYNKNDIEMGRPPLGQRELDQIAPFNQEKEYEGPLERLRKGTYVCLSLVGLCRAESLNRPTPDLSHLRRASITEQRPQVGRNLPQEPRPGPEPDRRRRMTWDDYDVDQDSVVDLDDAADWNHREYQVEGSPYPSSECLPRFPSPALSRPGDRQDPPRRNVGNDSPPPIAGNVRDEADGTWYSVALF